MSKLAIVSLIITASVPSFRRAGTTFTDAGKAFPEGYFTEEQLNDIHKEKKTASQAAPTKSTGAKATGKANAANDTGASA